MCPYEGSFIRRWVHIFASSIFIRAIQGSIAPSRFIDIFSGGSRNLILRRFFDGIHAKDGRFLNSQLLCVVQFHPFRPNTRHVPFAVLFIHGTAESGNATGELQESIRYFRIQILTFLSPLGRGSCAAFECGSANHSQRSGTEKGSCVVATCDGSVTHQTLL